MQKSHLTYFISLLFLFFISNVAFSVENAFEKNYQIQSPKGFQSFSKNPNTKMMRGWSQKTDKFKMLEDGYDLMGHSNFTGPYTSPNLALQHAKSIKADMVLLYDRQINDSSRATRIKKARDKARKANRVKETGNLTEIEINDDDLVDENIKYEINATYWVKLPKPTFGAHFIKLNSGIEKINGVQIIAIIKGSPAEIAGILKNDSITSIAGVSVKKPDDLISAIRKNKGKLIEVGYLRGGKQSKVDVKL
ncbi:PDZ domain-containing protein [Methylophilaceae bacterium]|jgi:hypothetical protein|nr:PDZ domain-containing protein [Methylophilaceae bacterium]|tara:strand:- start:1980 stop:2729 length:750 start_codon:yes stop_codon:yes gene_type:complete